MTANSEPISFKTLKRKAPSTVGRGKVVNLNTNLNFSAWNDESVALYLGDNLEHSGYFKLSQLRIVKRVFPKR
ncbi:hypothetical protein [Nostoc punctiforme]|uniref:hypothetical protein n=1 Tax=Nostoc punctiforme TaxID=272131 RepID=UPI000045BB92|nr:hypothetical protein [Nostoc punctiforme]